VEGCHARLRLLVVETRHAVVIIVAVNLLGHLRIVAFLCLVNQQLIALELATPPFVPDRLAHLDHLLSVE
jgi:hypothetical protein